MDLDFIGSELNITVIYGEAPEYALRFCEADGKTPCYLSNCSFYGVVYSARGEESFDDVSVTAGARSHEVLARFPVLAAGVYKYEIWAQADSGEAKQIIRGRYGVMSSWEKLRAKWDEVFERRTLLVRMPAQRGRSLELEMLASSVASAAARQAMGIAEDLKDFKEYVEHIEERFREQVESAQKKLEELKKAYEKAVEAKQDAAKEEIAREIAEQTGAMNELWESRREELKKLLDLAASMQGLFEQFQESVRGSIYVDPDTGCWNVGGVQTDWPAAGEAGQAPRINAAGNWERYEDGKWIDTGVKARGEDGYSPQVNARGYWEVRNKYTGEIEETPFKAAGADGIDGDSIVRHLIDSSSDLPKEGSTCNGGHLYYVRNPAAEYELVIQTPESNEMAFYWYGSFNLNGFHMEYGGAALYSLAVMLAENYKKATGGEISCQLTSNEDGTLNLVIRSFEALEFSTSRDDVKITLTPPPASSSRYYVYAWLENAQDAGAWCLVGEKNDISTKTVYGLTKLGTDSIISDGAPVGVNESGELHVARASWTEAGVVQPSVSDTITGGGIGVNRDGRLVTPLATLITQGTVCISFGGEVAEVIGLNNAGQLGVAWGSATQAGVFRAGYTASSELAAEYVAALAADSKSTLCLQLTPGGALKYLSGGELRTKNDALRDMPGDALKESEKYIFLQIGDGLKESAAGLSLTEASAQKLGGVYLSDDMEDERTSAVPTTMSLMAFLDSKFAKKEEYISVAGAKEIVESLTQASMLNYATKEDLEKIDRLTQTEADNLYMKKGNVHKIYIYTDAADVPAEDKREADAAYFWP